MAISFGVQVVSAVSRLVNKILQAKGPIAVLALLIVGSQTLAQSVSVTANPSTIYPGDSSTISWNASGVSSCSYNGQNFPLSGNTPANPATTTTYTLICTYGSSQQVSGSATLTVSPPAVSVSVSPSSISAGQQSTVTWSSVGATACTYNGASIASSGSSIVTLTATTTFALICSNSVGQNSASATVTVSGSSSSGPSSYSFSSLSNQPLNTVVQSSAVTLTGITGSLSGSVSGSGSPQVSINGGSTWATSVSGITNGTSLRVRMTTAGTAGTSRNATVTINGVSANWTTTTSGAGGGGSCSSYPTAPSNMTGISPGTHTYVVTGANGSGWGTGTYTDDSSLSAMAVHAGLVQVGAQAAISVTKSGGLSSYTGSTQNGITTSSYGAWSGSYSMTLVHACGTNSGPNNFSISNLTGQSPNTIVQSTAVTLTGISGSLSGSVSGEGSPQISTNGGSTWATSVNNITNGTSLRVRMTTANTANTQRTATININGVTANWSTTTAQASGGSCTAYPAAPATMQSAASGTYRVTGASGGGWGTDIYTDDSNVAAMAVHAGLVQIGGQAAVSITKLSGQSSYSGSTRNGITTSSYGSWGGSYSMTLVHACGTGPTNTGPSNFSISSLSNQAANTLVTSAPVTLTGITGSLTASVTGNGSPQISVNGGSWATSVSGIANNSSLQVRLTTGGPSSTRSATVTINGVSANWSVTTGAPVPVQLSAGFDAEYQVRSGDYNGDGRIDLYVSLKPQNINLPGVKDFILSQQSNQTFLIQATLNTQQRSAAQQWPLLPAQVELFAEDLNGDWVNDLFLKNLSSTIPGVNDLLVFASPTAGAAPTGVAHANASFKKFFQDANRWISDPAYFHIEALKNQAYTLTELTGPILGWWGVDYLSYVGYGNLSDSPYLLSFAQAYDSSSVPSGCTTTAPSASLEECRFTSGVWQVLRIAREYRLDFNFGAFSPQAIQLIQPHTVTVTDTGILRGVLEAGILQGSNAAVLIESILQTIFGGNVVFGGVLSSGAGTWGDHMPDTDEVGTSERKLGLSWKLARIINIIALLTTAGNAFDNWDLYHYANSVKRASVEAAGQLTPGNPTNPIIYFTDQLFPTGWMAKECLALPYAPPAGFWSFRKEDDVIALPSLTPVGSANFNTVDGLGYGMLKGGGREWLSTDPFVSVRGKVFISIPLGFRLQAQITDCDLGGIISFVM